MDKIVFKLLRVSSIVLAATILLAGNGALRAEPASEASEENTSSRIERTDPAFKSLQQLAAKYECLPEDSIILTGKRATVTRKAFVTNLNTCVQTIEELVARRKRTPVKRRKAVAPATTQVSPPVDPTPQVDNTPPTVPPEVTDPTTQAPPTQPPAPSVTTEAAEPEVTQQDLDTVKALISDFEQDLNALEGRINKSSFSTTTKLKGEAIINAAGYGGAQGANANSIIFSNRLRLNLLASTTGKDRLFLRLQSQNTPSFSGGFTGTNETRLGFDGDSTGAGFNNGGTVGGSIGQVTALSVFQYDFPISDATTIRLATTGYEIYDNQETFNSQLASSATGAVSRFGRFNPILRINNNNGATFLVSHKFSDQFKFDGGYFAGSSSFLGPGTGLFNGANAVLGQLTFSPTKELALGLIYGHSYDPNIGGTNGVTAGLTGATGSTLANNPFPNTATTANHYSAAVSYKLSPSAVISGWAGFIDAKTVSGAGSASISNYAVTLAFPDLGGDGNLLAFVVGIPPKVTAINFGTARADNSNAYHIEALYRLAVTENISITPGVLVIANPNNNSANPTEYVGVVRTTLKF